MSMTGKNEIFSAASAADAVRIRKDAILTLVITDQGADGEGIGKWEGFTVFVKDTVIGDTVEARIMKAKKTYGYAKLLRVLAPSSFRVCAPCPVARPCGGCQLQHLSYERQLLFKEDRVRQHLIRIGGFSHIPLEPPIGMEDPWHYRNKAQFPVGRAKDGRIIAGFYAGHTHAIIEAADCLLGVPENRAILDIILSHMERHNIEPYDEAAHSGAVRHILIRKGFFTKELMACIVSGTDRLPAEEELTASLLSIPGMASVSLNINKTAGNKILGERIRLLGGKMTITDHISGLSFALSPLSFFQVNPVQTEKLYAKALEYAALTGAETVWDLYCGIGTISLFLARKAAMVYGVEVIPQAIEDAQHNAAANRLSNVRFFCGKAEEIFVNAQINGSAKADVVVVDPPRKGCDRSLLEAILAVSPKRVVYISCDSATLARDAKILSEGGYSLSRCCPVDMFPHTVHVETVALLTKNG